MAGRGCWQFGDSAPLVPTADFRPLRRLRSRRPRRRPGRWRTQSPTATRVSWSSYMNLAEAASWRCHPVPRFGASFAFTRCAMTFPCVAAAMPRSLWRIAQPPVHGVELDDQVIVCSPRRVSDCVVHAVGVLTHFEGGIARLQRHHCLPHLRRAGIEAPTAPHPAVARRCHPLASERRQALRARTAVGNMPNQGSACG